MVLLGACLVTGCGSDSAPSIEGRWALQDTGGPVVIEFHADGTYAADTPVGDITGQWKVLDGGRIETWSDGKKPRRANGYRFDDGQLVITDAQGTEHRHSRLP